MITIHKTKTTTDFTIIQNSMTEDNYLSLPAIGLMAYLLKKPKDWKIIPKHLATKLYKKWDSKTSYRYILEIIEELIYHRYCVRTKSSNGAVNYEIYDMPNAEKLDTKNANSKKPNLDNTNVKKPTVEILHTNKEKIQYKEKNINKEYGQMTKTDQTKSLDISLSLSFETWYKLYPKKVKKLRTSNLFKKLTKKELDILIPATKLYIAYKQDNGEYFQNPDTFLNQKVFLDFADDIQQEQKELKQTDETHSLATKLAKKISINEGADFSALELAVIEDSKGTKEYASQITQEEFINFLKPYIKDRLC